MTEETDSQQLLDNVHSSKHYEKLLVRIRMTEETDSQQLLDNVHSSKHYEKL
jgi:hypothetical protein